MRVAIGTLSHEQNTFTTGRTTLGDFEMATDVALLDDFDAGGPLSVRGRFGRSTRAMAPTRPASGSATLR